MKRYRHFALLKSAASSSEVPSGETPAFLGETPIIRTRSSVYVT
jgi:hypothetical protein